MSNERTYTKAERSRNLDEGPVSGSIPSKIPNGEYEAVCRAVKIGIGFGGRRTQYWEFCIIGGRYDGTKLFMPCVCYDRPTYRTKQWEQWALATGRQPNKRERLSNKAYTNRLFKVLVRTTKRKVAGTNRYLPDYLQYSVVHTIIEPLTGEYKR